MQKFTRIVFLVLSVLAVQLAWAQQTVSGKVIGSDDDQPIPGVNVVIKGTSTGTVTDLNGDFSISAPEDAVLVISSVGYVTQEVSVRGRSTVNVTFVPDVKTLEDVVVSGYSIDTRHQTTGSVSTVKSRDIAISPSGNVEQQLQGRVAGVTVITNGQPGTTSQIRVRGFGALGGNEPLYIVDGLPVTSVDFLNPDDIESTTVLKDASSASIYGARAANGVIVYTTKRGTRKPSSLAVTFDGMIGVTTPGKGISTMNPTDFTDWTWKALKSDGKVPDHPQFGKGDTPVIPDYLLKGGEYGADITGPVDLAAEAKSYNVTNFANTIYQVVKANKSGTDWYKAITRNAPIYRATVGINGGFEKGRYYFGLGIQDQAGILLGQKLGRYTFRANSEFDISKKLRIGENLQFTYRETRILLGQNGGQGVAADENVVLSAFRMPSIIPVYDEFGGYAGTAAQGFNNPANPVAALNRQKDDRSFSLGGLGNVYLEYEPLKDLVFRSTFGGTYSLGYLYAYGARSYENSENNGSTSYTEGSSQRKSWVITNTLSFKKKMEAHDLDVLLGQEALNTGIGKSVIGIGLNPFTTDRDFVTLSTTTPGSTRTVSSDYYKGVNFSSYFARLNYGYKDRYLVSVVVRRDGSSRFGQTNRYGVFPAFSLAWRISEESFMSSLTWIDDLKLRGGYGIMGNSNNVDPNNQYSLYATGVGQSSYPIGNSAAVAGYYRSRIGNPNAKWEKATTVNVGLDGSFFKGRLDVYFDVWDKKTNDLLLQQPITVENGYYAAAPSVNVGTMENRGIDIQLVGRGDVTHKLQYEITINGSFLRNRITSLNEGATYLTSVNPDFRGISPIRNSVGQSISSFYGYKVVGLFKSAEEVRTASAQDGAGVGRFRYEDVNGDGVINEKDRVVLGSPVPKFTGGMNFKITYQAFSLECYLFTSIGNKIFNVSKWFTDFYPSFAGAAISNRVKDSWTPTNTSATIPIFENVSNFSTNTQSNSFYVENGSYLRMQNLTLSYNVLPKVLQVLKISRMKIFASVNNVFTITKYKGLDPSVGGNADTNFGIDVGNFPITRSWTFGFNVGF